MPKYWMISNRDVDKNGLGSELAELTFYVSDKAKVDVFDNWTPCSPADFRKQLAATADAFPAIPETEHENQKHLSIFIHGFNNS